jgi:hypothetical protein
MKSISGGLNPYTDIKSKEVAYKQYEQIRRRGNDIENIARNTCFSLEQITIVKNYIFYDSHILPNGYSRFEPSYEMAQSWLRLSEKKGDRVQPHDVLLLHHELYEIYLLISNSAYLQSYAHTMAEQKFNYSLACRQYYSR